MNAALINTESPQEVIDAYVTGYAIGYKNGVMDGRSDSASFGRSSLEPYATNGEVNVEELQDAFLFRSFHEQHVMAKLREKYSDEELQHLTQRRREHTVPVKEWEKRLKQRGNGPKWASRQTRRQRLRRWLGNILLPRT